MKYAYYKGLLRVQKVELVGINTNGWSKLHREHWTYTIKLKNGKFKNVPSHKLTFNCI